MTQSFTNPRIEGRFAGERMRAWDVVWGSTAADLVVQNAYVVVKNGDIRQDGGEIRADGKFSLGYPRKDGGEEINASISMTSWPMKDLRHAFELDDYPVDGLASGEYHLFGAYTTPMGYGDLRIDHGRGVRRVVRRGQGRLEVRNRRPRRRAPRRHRHPQGHGARHRRGVRRLGRHLQLRRQRHPHPRRVARHRQTAARAAVRA